jgi:hypothetical protein
MEREVSGPSGVDLEAAVHADLMHWRAAHPRATLTEIELAVEAAVQRLRAQYLAEVVVPPPGTAPPPACPHCGDQLQPRGRRTRAVLTPGQPDPVRLDRLYLVCARCGAGVFPPG